jgi:hypothetical protein
MTRPRTWYDRKEYHIARKMAKSTGVKLFKFARQTRGDGVEVGYYVGNDLPTRLASAKIEQKKI